MLLPMNLYFQWLLQQHTFNTILFYREEKIQKPKILAELIAENYQVQEVNFDTMLTIVQSCQELQSQRFNGSLKQVYTSHFNQKPETSNFFTLFKGIVPGKKT